MEARLRCRQTLSTTAASDRAGDGQRGRQRSKATNRDAVAARTKVQQPALPWLRQRCCSLLGRRFHTPAQHTMRGWWADRVVCRWRVFVRGGIFVHGGIGFIYGFLFWVQTRACRGCDVQWMGADRLICA